MDNLKSLTTDQLIRGIEARQFSLRGYVSPTTRSRRQGRVRSMIAEFESRTGQTWNS